jgi:hypothetical protein
MRAEYYIQKQWQLANSMVQWHRIGQFPELANSVLQRHDCSEELIPPLKLVTPDRPGFLTPTTVR